jgi:RNA polymerase sigma factor (sigma-70 family)
MGRIFRRKEQQGGRTEHLSDHGLLALVGRGDREALATLYDRYADAAYALALRVVRDRELAADVVQDAFLAVWKGAGSFDARRGQPSTWILTLTHHKAVDLVRREDRRRAEPIDQRPEGADTGPTVEERAWLAVMGENVRAALARLADPHREIIELAYFAGYTQSELAERLALPIGTVKSRTFAAMTALREALAAAGLQPEEQWNTSTS